MTPNEKLAASLAQLHELQKGGRRVFRSKEIGRVHRERLLKNGFLQEVIRGWLITTNPGADIGDTTPWYTSFWEFCGRYCNARFADNWNLSAEQSLLLHTGKSAVPSQILVAATKGTNNVTNLLFNTSLLDLKQTPKQRPPTADLVVRDDLRLFTIPAALIKAPEHFYQQSPVAAQVALSSIRDASELLGRLLEGGHSGVASRLTGAFRRVGSLAIADEIAKTMKGAGYDIRESDPFAPQQKLATLVPGISPVAGRIRALWAAMRDSISKIFPKSPGLSKNKKAYLTFVDDIYKSDAYHSLSIEGYTITPELIERVRTGAWNPSVNQEDRETLDALAALGYLHAFRQVKETVGKLIEGKNGGVLIRETHRDWYREMFQPAVAAGLLRPAALAGYRGHPVYIKGSRHAPPRWESVPDAMTTFFDLLKEEKDPSVQAVLGHWMFGYIHPFPDGNGRMARFLMNALLASGGYPWTVIRVEDRAEYMEALESASVGNDIKPFATFIADRIQSSTELAIAAAAAPVGPPRRRRRAPSEEVETPKPRRRTKKQRASSAA